MSFQTLSLRTEELNINFVIEPIKNNTKYEQTENFVFNIETKKFELFGNQNENNIIFANIYVTSQIEKPVNTLSGMLNLDISNGLTFEETICEMLTNQPIIYTNNPSFLKGSCFAISKDHLNLFIDLVNRVINEEFLSSVKKPMSNLPATQNVLKYKMYGFVPYNLSEIQKGIQFGHAVVEYSLKNFNTKEYQNWANFDKTFIILNGGTVNDVTGTMNALFNELVISCPTLKISRFFEPDLNNMMTSFVFLADETVWDEEKYPYDLDKLYDEDELLELFGDNYQEKIFLRYILKGKKMA